MSVDVLLRAVNWVSRLIAAIGLFALIGLALMVMAEVSSRWLLGISFPGSHDIMQLVLPVIVAATFPAAVVRRQHIAITFLGSGLGPRAAFVLDLFGGVVMLLVMALITWQLMVYAADVTALEDSSWILGLPLAPTWWVAALLFGLTTVCQIVILIDDAWGQIRKCGPRDEGAT